MRQWATINIYGKYCKIKQYKHKNNANITWPFSQTLGVQKHKTKNTLIKL
jgi:hypothetical protein